jgi:hypothetical protein
MKKLLLEDLRVESFVTQETPKTRGTVVGHSGFRDCADYSEPYVWTCDRTCANTCGDFTYPGQHTCDGNCIPTFGPEEACVSLIETQCTEGMSGKTSPC